MKAGVFRCGLFVVALFVLAGCSGDTLPPGVVALVNGKPITIRMVEARHDADGAFATIAKSPSVDLLREQYGNILAELVVQELVAQELDRLGISVSEEDVTDAMLRVQDDYPDDSFSETLFADNIDEQTWKALMRYTVVMLRFNEQVLRPQVSLASEEVEKYYMEHAAEFLVPAHDEWLILSSLAEESLVSARERVLSSSSLLDLADVHTQRVELRPGQVPEVWLAALAQLKEGEASRIREVNGVYQCVILEKKNPARRMAPVETYPRIEQVLVEWKMKTLFAEWLDAATAEATVKANPLLYRGEQTAPTDDKGDVPLNSEPIEDTVDEETPEMLDTGTEGATLPDGTPPKE